ncbi:MAG: molybdenum cofactor biosynthesis protein [Armatimonadota bacterium]
MNTEKIQVRVMFLGPAKDLTGCDNTILSLPKGSTLSDAIEALLDIFPNLRERLSHYRFAVNADYTNENTPLEDGDEVALIPPVSGGAIETEVKVVTKLTKEAIELEPLFAFVSSPEAGAVVTFVGTVREFSHGKKIVALTYEAYEPMAEKELQRIADEMMNRWQLCKVAIVHRIGELKVGEVAVAIFVSAPHRADAFAAARHAIERIKEIVPIWKREQFADGTSQWVSS